MKFLLSFFVLLAGVSSNAQLKIDKTISLKIPDLTINGMEPFLESEDLKAWKCGDFYKDQATLVRFDRNIKEVNLEIIGAEVIKFGSKHSILIRPTIYAAANDWKVALNSDSINMDFRIKNIPEPFVEFSMGANKNPMEGISLSSINAGSLLKSKGVSGLTGSDACYPLYGNIVMKGNMYLLRGGKKVNELSIEYKNEIDLKELEANVGDRIIIEMDLYTDNGNDKVKRTDRKSFYSVPIN